TLLSVLKGFTDIIYIILPTMASILIFYLRYNKYPAKVFPGNAFTYGIGAFYASLAIYWNFEKFAIYTFTLYFVELLLFVRGLLNKVYKENFGIAQIDGSLLPPYGKSYSLTHWAIKLSITIKSRCYEKDVVNVINILQVIVCTIALAITIAT
ncbi:MAG: glycosyl transferase family 4, partial [Desulfurococcaceae archaeon]